MEVPPFEDLPLFTRKAGAGANILGTVRIELFNSPLVRQVNQLVDIARPFAKKNMKLMKPSLTREFNQHVPFKVSLTLTIVDFIVSTALHFLFIYLYHRFHIKTVLRVCLAFSMPNLTIVHNRPLNICKHQSKSVDHSSFPLWSFTKSRSGTSSI